MAWLIPIILIVLIVSDIVLNIDSNKILKDKGFFFSEEEED